MTRLLRSASFDGLFSLFLYRFVNRRLCLGAGLIDSLRLISNNGLFCLFLNLFFCCAHGAAFTSASAAASRLYHFFSATCAVLGTTSATARCMRAWHGDAPGGDQPGNPQTGEKFLEFFFCHDILL